MKATGIVRRIDDLGRVVIPKEIRRTMRIREGDPLEIYTGTGGEVVFKKYSPVGELSSFAAQYAEALASNTKLAVLICDRDTCIAAAGAVKKDVIEQNVTPELEEIMEGRRCTALNDKTVYAVDGNDRRICVAAPILSAGDIGGAVVLLENNGISAASDTDVALASVAADFLGRHIE